MVALIGNIMNGLLHNLKETKETLINIFPERCCSFILFMVQKIKLQNKRT